MPILRIPHFDLHLEYILFPPKLRWLYLSHMLRSVSMSMVTLFVPIFLFLRVDTIVSSIPILSRMISSTGPEYYITAGLVILAVYFGLSRAIALVSLFPMVGMMRKFGLHAGMVTGNIMLIVTYAMLFLADLHPIFILFAAVFNGLELAAYWVPYYSIFSTFAKLDRLGEEVSGLMMTEKLARILSPLLGGIIATAFGFSVLYVVGVIIMILAINAILMMKRIHISTKVEWKEFSAWMKKPGNHRVSIAMIGRLFEILALLSWPVFLYQIVRSVSVVGMVTSFAGLLSLMVMYFAGIWLAKHRGQKLFYFSGGILSMLWLLRLSVQTAYHALAVDTVDRLFSALNAPIFEVLFLERSRIGRLFHFFVYREIVLSIAAMIFWFTVGVFALIGFGWHAVFILGAAGAIFTMLMPIQAHKKVVSQTDGIDG